MASLIPNTLNLTGSDLTGSDGTANRTYTINDSDILSGGLSIIVNGAVLMSGDYSWANPTITFTNIIDNTDNITVTYFTEASSSSGNLSYSSTLSLTQFLGLMGTIPNNTTKTRDNLGTGDGTNATFWFAHNGVIDSTYTLYYGANESSLTELTETTHYTVDLDLSKVTLTSAGITAVGGNTVYAEYKYNITGIENSDLKLALSAAEDEIERKTELVFAEYTATNPSYIKITNEKIKAQYRPEFKVFDLMHVPLVKLQTTVDGAYTTGGTTIDLTSATGFPNSGTIYIGGNKVAYTGKSTNTLTIPSSTPSIADAATVRGEVIELSMEPEGSSPSYSVLTPDTDYEIDYNHGRIKILNNAFFGEISAEDRIYPSNHLIRASYMSAWHEMDRNPTIPDEIEWLANAIATRRLMGALVGKANLQGMDGFKPNMINVDRKDIGEVLMRYKALNVSTSMFNKQTLS